MKIVDIQAMRLKVPPRTANTPPRHEAWRAASEIANPMAWYPKVKANDSLWLPPDWDDVWCKVILEDGTWGLGSTQYGRPVAAIIDDHLGPKLIGEDGLAIETLSNMMWRLTKLYGSMGIASFAVSAVDLALWDAKGRLLDQPVHSLIGGPQKEKLFCYATGNDLDWYQELGFDAFKIPCPYGPADGLDSIYKNEQFVAKAREQVGGECELMLDCFMAFDVEYSVRLAEQLRPYNLKWLEECLVPEAFDAHLELRQRIPWQILTTGEHWQTHMPFQWALRHDAVDVLQPDITWCGGLTTCILIAHAAQSVGKQIILHGGAHTVFGQHFSYAMPNVSWLEYYIASPPGVPLNEVVAAPGQAVAEDGWLTPNEGPGFGHEIPEEWLEPYY